VDTQYKGIRDQYEAERNQYQGLRTQQEAQYKSFLANSMAMSLGQQKSQLRPMA